jgi:hypothetical protein
MNYVIQFEGTVSCSRSKQLPTDLDYAVSTREYQLDQSSPLPASAAADPVLERQRQKQTPESVPNDRVTPYQRPLLCINPKRHQNVQRRTIPYVKLSRIRVI